VRSFYQSLFHGRHLAERLNSVQAARGEDPAIAEILAFIAQGQRIAPLSSPPRRQQALMTDRRT